MKPRNPFTLGLDRPHDAAADLLWVLEELAETSDPYVAARLCRFGALTAWHLHEWVWAAIKDRFDLHARMAKAMGQEPKRFDIDGFVDYILSKHRCPDLRYCKVIATASKHTDIDRAEKDEGPDIEIHGSPLYKAQWKIRTEDRTIFVEIVLENAFSFWYGFIVEHGLDPDAVGDLHPDAIKQLG